MNPIAQALLVGVLQGVLEWLPVSSEGNLALILIALLGASAKETIATAIFLHLGTGFAALAYFWEETINIIHGRTSEYADLRARLFVITLVTGLVGLPIYMWLSFSMIYGELLLALTGFALILTGVIEREATRKKQVGSKLSWPTALLLGAAQGIAVIPGVSRSGLTTSIMLLLGFTGEEAFHISFLMSIPASFAAVLGMLVLDGFTVDLLSVLSALVAGAVGYLAIDALLRVSRRASFWKTCLVLGALTVFNWLLSLLP